MKSRRGSTTSPIRVEKTCAASSASVTRTCSSVRTAGSSVVLPELVGVHLAQALEALDRQPPPAVRQDAVERAEAGPFDRSTTSRIELQRRRLAEASPACRSPGARPATAPPNCAAPPPSTRVAQSADPAHRPPPASARDGRRAPPPSPARRAAEIGVEPRCTRSAALDRGVCCVSSGVSAPDDGHLLQQRRRDHRPNSAAAAVDPVVSRSQAASVVQLGTPWYHLARRRSSARASPSALSSRNSLQRRVVLEVALVVAALGACRAAAVR